MALEPRDAPYVTFFPAQKIVSEEWATWDLCMTFVKLSGFSEVSPFLGLDLSHQAVQSYPSWHPQTAAPKWWPLDLTGSGKPLGISLEKADFHLLPMKVPNPTKDLLTSVPDILLTKTWKQVFPDFSAIKQNRSHKTGFCQSYPSWIRSSPTLMTPRNGAGAQCWCKGPIGSCATWNWLFTDPRAFFRNCKELNGSSTNPRNLVFWVGLVNRSSIHLLNFEFQHLAQYSSSWATYIV